MYESFLYYGLSSAALKTRLDMDAMLRVIIK